MDESLKKYTSELISIINKSHESFEKQLNYISAGALGLSMLFIEKVVKSLDDTKCNWILNISWCLFALTLISNLISHIYTSNVHDRTLRDIYAEQYDCDKVSKRNNRIKRWNIFSVSFLFAGITLQIIFISLNTQNKQNKMSKEIIKPAPGPGETRGFPASQPPKPNTGQPASTPPPSQPVTPPQKPSK